MTTLDRDPPAAGAAPPDDELVRRTEELAARLLSSAVATRSRSEVRQGKRIARLLEDPDGLGFITALTDEVLRIRDRRRAARHLRSLVASARGRRFLGPLDAAALRVGAAMAEVAPRIVMPLVTGRVRAELRGFVIPAEDGPLGRHIARRAAEGTRLNLNLLGEAILGDADADRRLEGVLGLLCRPDVDYVSVKVSSVCSQLNVVAFDHEVDRVAARLRTLYDEAMRSSPAKFVNLDMEEYRDLGLTVEVFRRVLDEPAYRDLQAGIVLQAYLPDSLGVLEDLVAWARGRRAPVKVRIVKGANLAMEKVEAELAGWSQAPYATKAEVDANYKRMLDVALDPANVATLRVGVATHNLFEAAWALTVARARGLADMVEIEMLEGMVPAMAAAVRAEAGGLLLYAPIAHRADHESVIAYLVRRFDENSGVDNFLRDQFTLSPGSPTWEAQRARFRAAVAARHQRGPDSRRAVARPRPAVAFANCADTDVSLPASRAWIAEGLSTPLPAVVPVVAAGRRVDDGPLVDGIDPSDPSTVAYRWVRADVTGVDDAVACARGAGERWSASDPAARRSLLGAVADSLEAARGRLLGVMAADAGKIVAEGDPEVSEAVDFARYYAQCAASVADRPGARFSPHGVVVVVPPWNFPLAIPAGGVLAALAAGNAVILKPAPETVATAWALAEACWAAGVPEDLLQFVPCADDDAGRRLVTHPGVDAVVLTGAWETARMFLGWRPDLRLHAETSGKNALVVTAAADIDGAVADLVRSAFGHAGQKCSAASLAIVEASVYDDPGFRRQLADAVRSLRPGPGTDLRSTMGPLIRPPSGALDDALRRLGPGETWLVEPRVVGANPHLWSPGVKLGVRPGSSFHLTECFGPVLGVMRARDLDQAIAWQNLPAYGLTAGLHSLDPAEVDRWRDRVEAGNLYVNRHTTGAVVRRQPFGGWKRSVVGPGHKAGGPHYVASLGRWESVGEAPDPGSFEAEVGQALRGSLAPVDPSGLAAESDVLRHLPLATAQLVVGEGVAASDVALALAAARAVGTRVTVTQLADGPSPALAAGVDKVRLLGRVGDDLRLAAHDAGLWVDDVPVVADPELEVLRWVREQALSEVRHRHGNLTGRHGGLLDPRSPTGPR